MQRIRPATANAAIMLKDRISKVFEESLKETLIKKLSKRIVKEKIMLMNKTFTKSFMPFEDISKDLNIHKLVTNNGNQ